MKTYWNSLALVGLTAVFLLGATVVTSDRAVEAEVRRPAQPKAFLSGSERSELILREMAQTLKSIDTRLARLEALAATTQPQAGRAQEPEPRP